MANDFLVIFTDLTATLPRMLVSIIAVASAISVLKSAIKGLKEGTSEFAKGYLKARGKEPQKNTEQ
jgi:hypothetical protein